MRGSPEERAAVKKSFERMNLKEKAAYIFAYYKLPLFTAFVVLAVAVSSLYDYITVFNKKMNDNRQKDFLDYMAEETSILMKLGAELKARLSVLSL